MLKHLLLILLFPLCLNAQSYPGKPVNYVTDEAGVLNEQEQLAMNRKLRTFEDSTSNQIFVYLAPSLNGKEIGDVCQEIFHNWHIGSKGKNNGILIGIFVNDHKFRIHTGYGLEGALPDILTKRIQDEDMRPYFKQNDYYTGIDKGIDQLIYYSGHEYKSYVKPAVERPWIKWIITYSINIVVLIIFFLVVRRNQQEEKTRKGLLQFSVIFALMPFVGAFFILCLFLYLLKDKFPKISWPKSNNGKNERWRNTTINNDSGWSFWDSSSSSLSDSSSGSSFDGGGGGDSGGGGSSSDW